MPCPVLNTDRNSVRLTFKFLVAFTWMDALYLFFFLLSLANGINTDRTYPAFIYLRSWIDTYFFRFRFSL